MNALPDQKPSRKLLYIPFILFGIICAAWAGGWFYAKGRAEQAMDLVLDRQKQAGRIIACPDRQISGFPFRFALACARPSFELTRPDGTVLKGRIEGFQAYARIYAPTHLIAEAKGPLVLTNQEGEGLQVNWTSLEASYQGTLSALTNVSIAAKGLKATPVKSEQNLGTIDSLEAHLRPVPDKPAGTYALAALLDGAQIPEFNALLDSAEPARLEIQVSADKLTEIDRRDWRVTAENWRRAGGRLTVALFKLTKGRLAAEARGDLGLDGEKRPQGNLNATVAGAEQLLARFGLGRQGGAGGLLGAILGGSRNPQQPARSISIPLPLRLEQGRAFLGPVPLGALRPLY